MPKLKEGDLEPESGLADDVDAAIVSVRFDVRREYEEKSGSSDPMLLLMLQGPELDQPIEQAYSIGGVKRWEAQSGGRVVVSAKQPDSHRWNAKSRAGELVERMFALIGGGDRKKGQEFFRARDHYMTEADFYTGLNFHWKREKKSTVGGEEREILMPVAYLGEVKATAGVAAPSLSDATDKLVVLAVGKTEREVKAALLKEPDLRDNTALLNEVFNKNLLGRLEVEGRLAKEGDKFTFKV